MAIEGHPRERQETHPAPSSRVSRAGAGWRCQAGRYTELLTRRNRPFKWLSPAPLWASRNDRLARLLGDPTNDRRRAWVQQLGGDPESWILDYTDREDAAFLLLGDTGEGDASQYAVTQPLLSRADGTSFMFICSDVIYPAGGVDDYEERLFRPYQHYAGPIHAIPGNHDWYDDATGFMHWFCGQEHAPSWPRPRLFSKAWLRRLLWRRAPRAHADAVERTRALRPEPLQQTLQPGPYLALDVGPVRLVGIDTGITGGIDREQAAWLRTVSQGSRPKILLTGKPFYVDGKHRPGAIEGEDATIDEIVRAPEHNYIAAIGGDIHNYQRYPVELPDGRTLMYLVNGGGGAFMHQTHTIPNLDTLELPVSEAHFRCYPLRGDSLSRFSQLYARKLRPFGRMLEIPPDQAAAYVSERTGIPVTRDADDPVEVTRRTRRAAALLFRLPARGRRGLHLPFSEWLDWNQPPMFKSFLRIDTRTDRIDIRCYAATGCADQQDDPPVEDHLVASREADGTWSWVQRQPGGTTGIAGQISVGFGTASPPDLPRSPSRPGGAA